MHKRKIAVICVALVAASDASAQRDVAEQSRLSPTDKTLWLVPDLVSVGTILRTDPTQWTKDGDAYLTIYNNYLVGKLPSGPGPKGSETLTVSKKLDISTILPFIKLFSASFKKSRTITLTTQNGTIEQIPEVSIALNALQAADRAPKDQGNGSAFVRLRAGAAAAGERADRASFWLITKVYRAGQLTWADNKGHSFAIGAGCPTVVQAELTSTASPKQAPTVTATPTPSATSAPNTATATPTSTASISALVGGNTPPAVSMSAAVGTTVPAQPPSTTTTGTVQATTTPSCTIARLSAGNNRDGNGSTNDAIVFVQMKPIFMNPRTRTLYFPDRADAPKVVSRS